MPSSAHRTTARSPGAEAGLEAAGATLREISVKCAARCEIARYLSTQPGGRAAGKNAGTGPRPAVGSRPSFGARLPDAKKRAPTGPSAYLAVMAQKSKPSGQAKKPGRSLKEKRATKHQKQATQKQIRKSWENQ
jgi:hypothetical protein